MTGSDPATRRLEVAGLAPLVAELSRRFADGSAVSVVTVRDLDEEQREAIADLLGQDRLPGRRAELRVATLVAVLGLSDGDELRSLVEGIVGPLGNRRADREERRRQRAQLWSWCTEQIEGVPLLALSPGAPVWVDQLRQAGVRGGEDGERVFRQRLEQAVTVLRALPVSETVSLASFADDQLADPHALDRGGALEGLVLDGLALGLWVERPRDAETVRQLWEQVGVVPDPISSTVTVLGLRPTGAGDLAGWLRNCADASEPAVVTLAQLRRWPMDALDRSDHLYVVENPSVISDAASRGWAGPPIACSSGRPSVAVVTLIRRLGAKGAACRQHADFDGAGLAITAWLTDRAGTTPWLMTADAYRAAVAMPRRRVPLREDLPETPWDPLLAPAMQEGGVAVYEEELRFSLLSAMES
ncbi:MAG TPA: TIGR02679 family protein [Acidimicrobiales bacterium]|nr:TIGR02679 family protein [Acidimicrobiales bacterium]